MYEWDEFIKITGLSNVKLGHLNSKGILPYKIKDRHRYYTEEQLQWVRENYTENGVKKFKTCKICGRTLPLENFRTITCRTPFKSYLSHMQECKECEKIRNRERIKKYKPKKRDGSYIFFKDLTWNDGYEEFADLAIEKGFALNFTSVLFNIPDEYITDDFPRKFYAKLLDYDGAVYTIKVLATTCKIYKTMTIPKKQKKL